MFVERLTPEQADALHRYSVDHTAGGRESGRRRRRSRRSRTSAPRGSAIGLVHVLALDLTISTYLAGPTGRPRRQAEYELAEIVLRATQALASHYRRLG
jgi:hypothetical protein